MGSGEAVEVTVCGVVIPVTVAAASGTGAPGQSTPTARIAATSVAAAPPVTAEACSLWSIDSPSMPDRRSDRRFRDGAAPQRLAGPPVLPVFPRRPGSVHEHCPAPQNP